MARMTPHGTRVCTSVHALHAGSNSNHAQCMTGLPTHRARNKLEEPSLSSTATYVRCLGAPCTAYGKHHLRGGQHTACATNMTGSTQRARAGVHPMLTAVGSWAQLLNKYALLCTRNVGAQPDYSGAVEGMVGSCPLCHIAPHLSLCTYNTE